MASKVSILQPNVGHCIAAQDLLIQTVMQWQMSVAVVSEPYHVHARDDWASDMDGTVAIVAQRPLDAVLRDRGSVLAKLGDVAVFGVYFSPSRSLAQFKQMLVEAEALLADVHPTPVVVAGDFNAKSRAWGSPMTDDRGRALEEWAVASGLVLLNHGAVHTCVRPQGSLIVDVSFASPALARRTSDWRVVEGVETLSDHRYIRFDIAPLPSILR